MNLKPNYVEYYKMDLDPTISSRLDKCADDIIDNYYLRIESDNQNIKNTLDFLFNDTLSMNCDKLWIISRQLLKFGNYYMRLSLAPAIGIFKAVELPVFNVIVEEKHNFNKQYIIDDEKCENHEMAHFKLIRSGDFLPYGEPILNPALRIYKQLQMLEDAILIKRIIKNEAMGGDDISDIEYMTNKLIAAMEMQESGSSELTDIRYARRLDTIRKSIIMELEKIAMIHLYTIDKKRNDLVDFKLFLEKKEQ